MNALRVRDLAIRFDSPDPGAPASTPVRSCSLDVAPGEVVGLVGESGCGKSLTALACLGLLPAGARTSGTIEVNDIVLGAPDDPIWAQLRGRKVAMIFQNPMSALNPFFTLGAQLEIVIRTHFAVSRLEARRRAREALERTQLGAAAAVKYPHQMSGGQLQRAMIAMALACAPDFLIADEPTTALDVTVQANIVRLLRSLIGQGMGLLLISHDLELVAQVCDRIYVMYAGRIMETGRARDLARSPSHPYTAGLLRTQPRLRQVAARLNVIEGRVPSAQSCVEGCVFANRCGRATEPCAVTPPPILSLRPGSAVACYHPILPPLGAAAHDRV